MTSSGFRAQWWVELANRLLAYLPSAAEDWLKRRMSCLLPLMELRVPLVFLRGSSRPSGRPVTLLVAGGETRVSYMSSRFFTGAPQREFIRHAPLWKLKRLLRRYRLSADMTIVCVDRLSARLFVDDDYLAVPDWVGVRMMVPVDLDVLAKSNHSLAEDIRRTRRNGLRVDVSHEAGDFEDFYARMYLPYTRIRHGAQAHVRDARDLRRAFRKGGILSIQRAGERVAGHLFEHRSDRLDSVAIGVANGDETLLKDGVVAALYVHLVEYARQQGCTEVDLRGSRPSLHDGVLRFKRKWGASIYQKRDVFYSTLVYWNRADGAAAEFLSHTSLIFRDGDGLSGVGVVGGRAPWTSATLQAAHDDLWCPGLRRLCLLTDAPPLADSAIPQRTRLIDGASLADGGPRALLAAINSEMTPRTNRVRR